MLWRSLLATKAPPAVVLIRLMVGAAFLSEGIQKFLYPDARGVGRFEIIGLPEPELLAYFVAVFEIVCGALLLAGLLTRLAAVPLVIIMLTAIATTKFPMLLQDGFWTMAHEARTDWAMLLGSLFLIIVGAGRLSLDAQITKPRHEYASDGWSPAQRGSNAIAIARSGPDSPGSAPALPAALD